MCEINKIFLPELVLVLASTAVFAANENTADNSEIKLTYEVTASSTFFFTSDAAGQTAIGTDGVAVGSSSLYLAYVSNVTSEVKVYLKGTRLVHNDVIAGTTTAGTDNEHYLGYSVKIGSATATPVSIVDTNSGTQSFGYVEIQGNPTVATTQIFTAITSTAGKMQGNYTGTLTATLSAT